MNRLSKLYIKNQIIIIIICLPQSIAVRKVLPIITYHTAEWWIKQFIVKQHLQEQWNNHRSMISQFNVYIKPVGIVKKPLHHERPCPGFNRYWDNCLYSYNNIYCIKNYLFNLKLLSVIYRTWDRFRCQTRWKSVFLLTAPFPTGIPTKLVFFFVYAQVHAST